MLNTLLNGQQSRLTPSDVTRLAGVTAACLSMPVQADSELGFLLTVHDDSLLPLHASIIKCLAAIEAHALTSNIALVPAIFAMYLQLCKLVHTWPPGAHQVCLFCHLFAPNFDILFDMRIVYCASCTDSRTSSPSTRDSARTYPSPRTEWRSSLSS